MIPADFTKVFHTFFMSSITEESADTRIVFLAMISLADENGLLTATEKRIAEYAKPGRTDDSMERRLDLTREALSRLQQPDPTSSTPDEDGRRIVPVSQNVWRIVTRSKYLELDMAQRRRDYKTEKQREYRRVKTEASPRLWDSVTDENAQMIEPSSGAAVVDSRGLSSLSPSPSSSSSFDSSSLREEEQEKKGRTERRGRARMPATKIPQDFAATPELIEFGKAQGLTERDVVPVIEEFTDFWKGNGEFKSDWIATARNWIRRVAHDPVSRRKTLGAGGRDDGRGASGEASRDRKNSGTFSKYR